MTKRYIFDNAKVSDNAVVCDNAIVCDNAKVFNDAAVFGRSQVFEDARVWDTARVFDDARVFGHAAVFGYANVCGHAHVFENANVFGHAVVCGNVKICGNAIIEKTSDYLTLGPAKSSDRFTTAHRDSVIGVRVNCGCFSGSVEEFEQAIKETHKENPEYLRQYLAFVYVIREHFAEEFLQ